VSRSIDQVRDAIEDALEQGDAERAVRLARESLRLRADGEGWYLLGVALDALGEWKESHEALAEAVSVDPGHADAHVALAGAAVEGLAFETAADHLLDALRADPAHADALHMRGCIRERRGDHDGALRDYTAASLVDPARYPLPQPLDDDTLEAVAEDVLRSLHPSLRAYLANVPILVEDQPADELLADLPEAHPFELLGCFTGRSLAEPGATGTWSALPATITLFRKNLQRFARDREELVSELRVTLLHEIGHYLGLDEDDLATRGLD
jgi:predicted Zn-dependent protease with MMP-like domain